MCIIKEYVHSVCLMECRLPSGSAVVDHGCRHVLAANIASELTVSLQADDFPSPWRIVADKDVRALVAQRIVAAGGSLTRLADLQPSLEEVYTRYFQEARHAA